jgi:hypothetical protein
MAIFRCASDWRDSSPGIGVQAASCHGTAIA